MELPSTEVRPSQYQIRRTGFGPSYPEHVQQRLNYGKTLIGRMPNEGHPNIITLTTLYASKAHCTIVVTDDGVITLTDHSTNGTWVGDEKVSRATKELRLNDVFNIGVGPVSAFEELLDTTIANFKIEIIVPKKEPAAISDDSDGDLVIDMEADEPVREEVSNLSVQTPASAVPLEPTLPNPPVPPSPMVSIPDVNVPTAALKREKMQGDVKAEADFMNTQVLLGLLEDPCEDPSEAPSDPPAEVIILDVNEEEEDPLNSKLADRLKNVKIESPAEARDPAISSLLRNLPEDKRKAELERICAEFKLTQSTRVENEVPMATCSVSSSSETAGTSSTADILKAKSSHPQKDKEDIEAASTKQKKYKGVPLKKKTKQTARKSTKGGDERAKNQKRKRFTHYRANSFVSSEFKSKLKRNKPKVVLERMLKSFVDKKTGRIPKRPPSPCISSPESSPPPRNIFVPSPPSPPRQQAEPEVSRPNNIPPQRKTQYLPHLPRCKLTKRLPPEDTAKIKHVMPKKIPAGRRKTIDEPTIQKRVRLCNASTSRPPSDDDEEPEESKPEYKNKILQAPGPRKRQARVKSGVDEEISTAKKQKWISTKKSEEIKTPAEIKKAPFRIPKKTQVPSAPKDNDPVHSTNTNGQMPKIDPTKFSRPATQLSILSQATEHPVQQPRHRQTTPPREPNPMESDLWDEDNVASVKTTKPYSVKQNGNEINQTLLHLPDLTTLDVDKLNEILQTANGLKSNHTHATCDPRLQADKPTYADVPGPSSSYLKNSTQKPPKRDRQDKPVAVIRPSSTPENIVKQPEVKPKASKKRIVTQQKLQRVNEIEVINQIVSWNPEWIENRNSNMQMNEKSLIPMTNIYESCEQYVSVISKILNLELMEIVKTCYNPALKSNPNAFPLHEMKILNIAADETLKLIHMEIEIESSELSTIKEDQRPRQGTLYFLHLKGQHGEDLKILSYTLQSDDPLRIPTGNKKFCAMLVCSYTASLGNTNAATATFSFVHNIRVEVLFLKSLLALKYSPLRNEILDPSKINVHRSAVMSKYVGMEVVNDTQENIILEISHTIASGGKNIFLIEGPPGTGKTRLLVNLLFQLMRGNEHEYAYRILVCTPSNAAIDVIFQRLGHLNEQLDRNERLKILRFGKPDKMIEAVRKWSVDGLIDAKIQAEMRKVANTFDENNEDQRKRKTMYTHKNRLVEQLKDEKVPKISQKLKHELRNVEKNIFRCEQAMYEMKTNCFVSTKKKCYKAEFLENSKIIGTTLGSSSLLDSSHMPLRNLFDTLIVDEASVSTEYQIHSALAYGVKNIILIGDTKQLPALVKSKEAIKLGLSTSLFQRIQETIDQQGVFTLTEQYRMHPDILSFPCRQYYKNQLTTSESAKAATKDFLLTPYLVMELDSEQNFTQSNSVYNTEETKFVETLLKTIDEIVDVSKLTCTIISPYQRQNNELQKQLTLNSRFANIQISTIDAMQGQERDIIILSCARTRGAGFLDIKQRLNVALTRAKKSLFICGNFVSLENCMTWSPLIKDAKRRDVYVKVAEIDNLKYFVTHPNYR